MKVETEETKKRNYLGGKGHRFCTDQRNWLVEWTRRVGKSQLVCEAAAEVLHSKAQADVNWSPMAGNTPFCSGSCMILSAHLLMAGVKVPSCSQPAEQEGWKAGPSNVVVTGTIFLFFSVAVEKRTIPFFT